MKWPLMSPHELHTFGIEAILPYVEQEGFKVEGANPDLKVNPQIVGKHWDSTAFVVVRTACYPNKGELTQAEHMQMVRWAEQHGATAFFASVGIGCVAYPDGSPVTSDEDMRLPIRHAG